MHVHCDENYDFFKEIRKYASRSTRNLQRPLCFFQHTWLKNNKNQINVVASAILLKRLAKVSFQIFHTTFLASLYNLLTSIGVLFMTPKMLLGIVPLKSFNNLTANKAFHQLLCCLHDEKSVPHFTLKVLFFTSSVSFSFKDITNREVIKLLYSLKN